MEEETILFESLINWNVAEAKLCFMSQWILFLFKLLDLDLYHLH